MGGMSRHKLWIWKALDRDTGQLLDWEYGRRDKKTLKKMVERLAPWDVQLYGTDKGATSAAVIPQEKLVQRKATTQDRTASLSAAPLVWLV